ncbi:MAG TPA: indolepyruvate ferredoxin oxidoreductase subunit beta [Thermoplasmatales archaeon]|nr:MAG: indolepyruvate ferredoxin oxidoreductase subunit beta [Thermoplasmata archaeon]HDN50163.1 indolepyruvate ferredoxin oxidoreductase subunit beta [Thermoplasmatales archaeon]
MKQSVVIAGVGGQGVLTAANILAKAALKEGHNVIASELHGMAQRGGDVECTVRIGTVFSPIVADETADAIIAFEPLEALRNLKKVKRDGVVITDINPIIPPLISIGLGSYEPLESIFDTIASHCRLIKIDADELARKAGSILTKNVVMLGAFHALHVMPLREESIIAVIKETIKEKYVDMNMNAFAMGKEAVQQKDI